MDNPEYTFQILEVFSKVRSKEIPRELEEYISYVARTGDPVFQWSMVKVLIKEKLQAVLSEFVENGGPVDVPPCPNVDPFDFDSTKELVLKQLDAFVYPPFTIQRICELLAAPRKEYNRVDKYMRAIEKNVLVVSASDLSMKPALDADANESVINGILYDKVNDSLTTFTNHVFAAASGDEDELVAAKIDETDAVQRIIDESWNEETSAGDDFKLNGSGSSFEHELRQFVAADKDDEAKTSEPSSSASSSSDENTVETSSSFDENSALLRPSLQTIIAEGASITFENVAKEDASQSPEPANDTYEFKDDSLEDVDVCPGELDLTPAQDVADSSEATPVDVADHDSRDQRPEFDCPAEEPSTTTLEMMAVAPSTDASISQPMAADGFDDAAQPESTSAEAAAEFGQAEDDYAPSTPTEIDDSGWITYSAGDFQAEADQPDEDHRENDGVGKVAPQVPSQPADDEPQTTTTEMETSQSAE